MICVESDQNIETGKAALVFCVAESFLTARPHVHHVDVPLLAVAFDDAVGVDQADDTDLGAGGETKWQWVASVNRVHFHDIANAVFRGLVIGAIHPACGYSARLMIGLAPGSIRRRA